MKNPSGDFKHLFICKTWLTLAICLTHLRILYLDFPNGKKSGGDFSPWGLLFYPIVNFSSEEFTPWQSIVSAFIHIYIIYNVDPAQLLYVVIKQVCKLHRFSLYAAHETCIQSLDAPVETIC